MFRSAATVFRQTWHATSCRNMDRRLLQRRCRRLCQDALSCERSCVCRSLEAITRVGLTRWRETGMNPEIAIRRFETVNIARYSEV